MSIVKAVALSPNGKNLVVGASGFFTSNDYGTTWSTNRVPGVVYSPIASSAEGTTLVAASATWLYHSTDSGTTWIKTHLVTNGIISGIASSADGGKLAVVVNGGGIWTWQAIPSPVLKFMPLNNVLTLSWIVPSADFVLQQNSDLSTTNWAPLTNTPLLDFTNLQNQVFLPVPANNCFYRLISTQ